VVWARFHDWAYLELADLYGDEHNATLTGLCTRGHLIQRSIADGSLAYFSTCVLAGQLLNAGFSGGPSLDHKETCYWHGWYRHVSLVMLAFAMMATIRHHANTMPPEK